MITVFLNIISHPIILMVVAIFSLISSFFFAKSKGRSFSILVSLFLLVFGVFNFAWGHHLSQYLINRHGVEAVGVLIAVEDVAFVDHQQPVMRYNLLIKTDSNEVIEVYFLNSDSDLHPLLKTDFSNFSIGKEFRLKYMENDPMFFTIFSEVQVGYSKNAVCNQVVYQLNEAMAKLKFDPQNERFQDDFALLLLQYEREDCYTNQATLEYYQDTFKRLNVEMWL